MLGGKVTEHEMPDRFWPQVIVRGRHEASDKVFELAFVIPEERFFDERSFEQTIRKELDQLRYALWQAAHDQTTRVF